MFFFFFSPRSGNRKKSQYCNAPKQWLYLELSYKFFGTKGTLRNHTISKFSFKISLFVKNWALIMNLKKIVHYSVDFFGIFRFCTHKLHKPQIIPVFCLFSTKILNFKFSHLSKNSIFSKTLFFEKNYVPILGFFYCRI